MQVKRYVFASSRTIVTRHKGPTRKSNGDDSSARTTASVARARFAGVNALRSTQGTGTSAGCAISCTGRPSRMPIVVRRTSCRAASAVTASASAPGCTSPVSCATTGT